MQKTERKLTVSTMSNPPPYTISRFPLLATPHFWQLPSSRTRIDLSALSIERRDRIYIVFAWLSMMTTTTENPADPPRPLCPRCAFVDSFYPAALSRLSLSFSRVHGSVSREFSRLSSRLLAALVCRVQSTDWPSRRTCGGSRWSRSNQSKLNRKRPSIVEDIRVWATY